MQTIKKIREQCGLTQKRAAWRLRITLSYLSQIERGLKEPKDKLKEKMCALYGKDIATIFYALKESRKIRERKNKKND